MQARLRLAVGIIMLGPAACDVSTGSSVGPSVEDSAGIRVVEHTTLEPPPGWQLSASPVTEIGLVDAEPAHQLNGVVGGTVLADGSIVVADGGSRELRFFGAGGQHMRTVIGRGEGPGEVRTLSALGRITADTIIATDQWPGMLVWFDSDGTFLTESTIQLRSRERARILPDGSLLVRFYPSAVFGAEVELFAVGQRDPDADGLYRPPFELVRIHRDGLAADTFGTFPGGEIFRQYIGGELGFVRTRPFFRHTLVAGGADHVFTSYNGEAAFHAYRLDGTLESIVRFPAGLVAVTAADLDAVMDTLTQRVNPNRRAVFERWIEAVPVPETKPAVGAIHADTNGRLWVLDPPAAEALTEEWTVFSADGNVLGRVSVPARSLALEIGADYFLGLWRDDLDVEVVRLYALTRPGT